MPALTFDGDETGLLQACRDTRSRWKGSARPPAQAPWRSAPGPTAAHQHVGASRIADQRCNNRDVGTFFHSLRIPEVWLGVNVPECGPSGCYDRDGVSSRMLHRNMTTAPADRRRPTRRNPRRAMPAGAWCWRAISRRCSAGASASTATASISPSSPAARLADRAHFRRHHRFLSAHRGAGGVRQRCHRQARTAAGDADRGLLLRQRGGAARRHRPRFGNFTSCTC